MGYSVTINHHPNTNVGGVFKIYAEANKSRILVYSNSYQDKDEGVVISSSPSYSKKEILAAILTIAGEK